MIGANLTRLGGILAIGGFAAALWYFFGYLGSVGWGSPGTEAYAVYERANRLASVPLLVHVAGWTLLVRDRAWRRVAAIGAPGIADDAHGQRRRVLDLQRRVMRVGCQERVMTSERCDREATA